MRIIVNAISANTGGIVTYTTNIVDYLARENLEAIVYVPLGFVPSPPEGSSIEIKPLAKQFWGPVHRFLWEQTGWRRVIKESGADVLFSSANYGVLFPPIPQVLLVQGEIYLNPVYREKVLPNLSWKERVSAYLRRHLMLWSARCSRKTVFPSQVALEAAADYDNKLMDTASVNYLGVNPRFDVHKKRRSWRADGVTRLLYVSVYYPHKDPMTLVKATRLLNERGSRAITHITMEPHDFHTWDHADAELSALLDPKHSEYLKLGRINHVMLSNALQEFDAFVFPSMAETFGFPMVEAMRAEVPLIVSDIPIHREICGDAALYFRLGDPDDLATRVMELDGNPSLRSDLIEQAHNRVEGQFTWENHVAKIATTIREIVEHKRHRLLINALHARTGGGVTYLRNVLPLMAKDPRLDLHVCLHEDQSDILPTNIKSVTYHYQRYPRGFWRILIREQLDVPRLAKRLAVDTTFSPANYGPFIAKNHILMARNAVSVGFVERRPLKLAYWALLYVATFISFAKSQNVIAVSDYAKRGITRAFFGLFNNRMKIVPHGVEQMFLGSSPIENRKHFLLAVSDIYVQKNFVTLIHALPKVRDRFPDLILKIAGRPIDQYYVRRLEALIDALDLKDCIEFLGHVEVPTLSELYKTCSLFVFPSTVETFGNPLVEALACGAPIASSNTAAMPEVLGDAARFFDPLNPEDMATVMIDLLDHEEKREKLSALARVRAKAYSWNRTVKRTVDVILNRERT